MSNAAVVEALFFAALEKGTVTEQSAYLDSACGGDAGLRRQVEKLLNAHPRMGDFLKKPLVEQWAAAPEQLGATRELDASTDGQGDGASLRRSKGAGSGDDEEDALACLQPSTRPDSLGRLRHYEVLQVLGQGGFGVVFRAFDESLQRMVAIKALGPNVAATSPARKRFLREARSSARVRHDNVVQVYAVEEQPLPFLVMEFIPGETLQQRLDRAGPLETAEVVRIGRQIAEGLAAAHATGLIHRDIKPANILLENGAQRVKITDFGLARAADDATLTQAGFLAGTPMYMAPEQAQGDALDHRADLFSLGSVLYTMCTGQPPFRAKRTLRVLRRVAEETPQPIREIRPEVPRWLCDLIARLHAKKPEERISTAREVADLLERGPATMPGPGDASSPEETPEAAPPKRPRSRSRLWAAAAAVILLVLGSLSFTEATGVTNVSGTVIRLFSPEGTLVVEVDDPGVSVKIDGSELVITGAGAKEIRLKPGRYTVEARKDGKVMSRELVTVARNGRQVVRVSQEASPPDTKPARRTTEETAWERNVTSLTAAEQVKAVAARLKQLNPGFDGKVAPTIEDGVVTGLQFCTDEVDNIAPVRALTGLTSLDCRGTYPRQGKLSDLAPLKGMSVSRLDCSYTQVSKLTGLEGMPLTRLYCHYTNVSDLAPLKGMALGDLGCASTSVSDLSPLKGMKLQRLGAMSIPASDLAPLEGMPLTMLDLYRTSGVTDLKPLKGMPLDYLNLTGLPISDISVLKGMTSLRMLVLEDMPLADLTSLRGLKVESLAIKGTKVSNLSALKALPLTDLAIDYRADQGESLRSFKGLERINGKPAAQFWMEVGGK
jgi:serine/threonine protein kinase